jgi:hypothetical protein
MQWQALGIPDSILEKAPNARPRSRSQFLHRPRPARSHPRSSIKASASEFPEDTGVRLRKQLSLKAYIPENARKGPHCRPLSPARLRRWIILLQAAQLSSPSRNCPPNATRIRILPRVHKSGEEVAKRYPLKFPNSFVSR